MRETPYGAARSLTVALLLDSKAPLQVDCLVALIGKRVTESCLPMNAMDFEMQLIMAGFPTGASQNGSEK